MRTKSDYKSRLNMLIHNLSRDNFGISGISACSYFL